MTTAETATCPQCSTPLVIAGIAPGSTFLCSTCGAAAGVRPKPDLRRTSRSAAASLVLGLAALPLTCITGIPAVLLGCLALFNIRRRPDQLKGRNMAIAGVATGGLFGIVCAPIVAAIILSAIQQVRAQRMAADRGTQDPAEVARIASNIGQFQFPPGLAGFHALEGPQPGSCEAAFGTSSPSARVLILLVQSPVSPAAQRDIASRLGSLAAQYQVDVDARRQVTFLVAGVPIPVDVVSGADRQDGRPRRNYTANYPLGTHQIGILVSTGDEPPPDAPAMAPGDPSVNLTEDEVKAFFESIRW